MFKKEKREISLWSALIPFVFLIVFLAVSTVYFKQEPHIPLVAAAGVAALVAMFHGYSWNELNDSIVGGMSLVISPLIILLLIGIMIGTWIQAGVVPAMIYYGLKILSPQIFLVASLLICSIVALGTGSSWSTAGTMGLALMAIGDGMGIPLPIVAGSIISGAYFGDKMSPLSDTTNLAPAVAGTDLFKHIKHMIYTTVPAYLISIVIFLLIGLKYGDSTMETGNIDIVLSTLKSSYYISPWLLLPPVLVIMLVVKKIPPAPAIFIGALIGGIFAMMFQGEAFANVMTACFSGDISNTGNEIVDSLLSRGGITSMFSTTILVICAMSFSGIVEHTQMLNVIMRPILRLVKGTGSLVFSTVLSCIALDFVCSSQYVTLVIGGKMYKAEFEKQNLKPKNLSRCLEDSGTLISPLVPWNTCGAFMWATLGINPFLYLPFAFFNWICPIISVIYGFTGFSMEKIDNKKDSNTNGDVVDINNDENEKGILK